MTRNYTWQDHLHMRDTNSAISEIREARSEILDLASEFAGIESTIIEGITDESDAIYLTEDFLSDRLDRLRQAYQKLHYYANKLREGDRSDD